MQTHNIPMSSGEITAIVLVFLINAFFLLVGIWWCIETWRMHRKRSRLREEMKEEFEKITREAVEETMKPIMERAATLTKHNLLCMELINELASVMLSPTPEKIAEGQKKIEKFISELN